MIESLVTLGIFVFGQALAGVVWGVRMEGKVGLQDQRITDLKELINTRFDALDQRLSRIEKSLNGSLHRD